MVTATTAAAPLAPQAGTPGPAAVTVALAPICPRCDAELVVRDEVGVVVAACPSQHGLFATHRALEGLAHHAADGPRVEDAPRTACPRCAEPMTARMFTRGSSILVDVCEEHGTWLDAGELRAAAAAAGLVATRGGAASEAGRDDKDVANGARAEVNRRAAAILDVSLALEEARDEETARLAVDVVDDLVDTFNVFVLGRARTGTRRRYR